MKTVTIYTDGACSGNPGPGGWGAILQYGKFQKELSGGEEQTTNNRMELTGVISALKALKEPCVVELWSDSKYVIDALEKGWARSWEARGWVKGDKKPALNPDLWERLKRAAYGSMVRRLNSLDDTCFELAQAHFDGEDYLTFPQVFQSIERGHGEALLREWCVESRTALSVVAPED